MRATIDGIEYEVEYEVINDEIDFELHSFIHVESVKLRGFEVTLPKEDILEIERQVIKHISEY